MPVGIAMLQDRLPYFPDKAALRDMVCGELRAWPTPQDFPASRRSQWNDRATRLSELPLRREFCFLGPFRVSQFLLH